jgi:hypothetical protein
MSKYYADWKPPIPQNTSTIQYLCIRFINDCSKYIGVFDEEKLIETNDTGTMMMCKLKFIDKEPVVWIAILSDFESEVGLE